MGNGGRIEQGASPRVIKRYSNRKLYDTRASSYVTLLNISEMVRSGEQVQVIDNATKEDKTDVTLALIISEELKANPREIPVAALRALVRSRGERIVHQFKEGPLGRLLALDESEGPEGSTPQGLLPGEAQIDEESMDPGPREQAGRGFRATLEQLHQIFDERIRAALAHWPGFQELERRVDELARRVDDLESRLASGGSRSGAERPGEGLE